MAHPWKQPSKCNELRCFLSCWNKKKNCIISLQKLTMSSGGSIHVFFWWLLQCCQYLTTEHRMVGWTEKDLEGSRCSLIKAQSQHFPGRTEENHKKLKTRIGRVLVKIWTGHLPNTCTALVLHKHAQCGGGSGSNILFRILYLFL
jgi:hypothetical protein